MSLKLLGNSLSTRTWGKMLRATPFCCDFGQNWEMPLRRNFSIPCLTMSPPNLSLGTSYSIFKTEPQTKQTRACSSHPGLWGLNLCFALYHVNITWFTKSLAVELFIFKQENTFCVKKKQNKVCLDESFLPLCPQEWWGKKSVHDQYRCNQQSCSTPQQRGNFSSKTLSVGVRNPKIRRACLIKFWVRLDCFLLHPFWFLSIFPSFGHCSDYCL